jgi:(2Fe-2S) ferredoxin
VRDALKQELGKHGLNGIVRANGAGCLDACAHGVALVIYPEGVWYGKVTVEDLPEIVERTIIRGEVIQRLLIPDPRYAPETILIPPLQAPGLLPHE